MISIIEYNSHTDLLLSTHQSFVKLFALIITIISKHLTSKSANDIIKPLL